MGFEKYDWLKNQNMELCEDKSESYLCSNCSETSSDHYSYSYSDDSNSNSNSHFSKCKSFKDKCHEKKKKNVIDGRRKVIHENIHKIRHIDKIYIQPIRRIKHEKKTFVYRLPTKHIDEKHKEDCGIEFRSFHRTHRKHHKQSHNESNSSSKHNEYDKSKYRF